MKKVVIVGLALALLLIVAAANDQPISAAARQAAGAEETLSLITETPDEGFALAVRLSRMGVATTQPDREVLQAHRPGYANDADALIAVSHVIAVHFQTVAEANDFWRD